MIYYNVRENIAAELGSSNFINQNNRDADPSLFASGTGSGFEPEDRRTLLGFQELSSISTLRKKQHIQTLTWGYAVFSNLPGRSSDPRGTISQGILAGALFPVKSWYVHLFGQGPQGYNPLQVREHRIVLERAYQVYTTQAGSPEVQGFGDYLSLSGDPALKLVSDLANLFASMDGAGLPDHKTLQAKQNIVGFLAIPGLSDQDLFDLIAYFYEQEAPSVVFFR